MTALLTTTSALPAGAGTSTAEACVAELETDRILASLRPSLLAQLRSHKAPSFQIDHVIGANTADARLVSVVTYHRFLGQVTG